MIIEQVDQSKRNKLYLSLTKYVASYSRRSVVFIITAQSEYVANLEIFITGKRGTAQKSITICYNETKVLWEAYCDGYKYTMLSLSEITNLAKTQIAKLTTILTKL